MSNAVIYMKSNCKYYHEPTDVIKDADVHDVEPFTTCVTGDIQQLLEPPVSFSLMQAKIWMQHIEGVSQVQIAQDMGIAVTTVNSHLRRARDKIGEIRMRSVVKQHILSVLPPDYPPPYIGCPDHTAEGIARSIKRSRPHTRHLLAEMQREGLIGLEYRHICENGKNSRQYRTRTPVYYRRTALPGERA